MTEDSTAFGNTRDDYRAVYLRKNSHAGTALRYTVGQEFTEWRTRHAFRSFAPKFVREQWKVGRQRKSPSSGGALGAFSRVEMPELSDEDRLLYTMDGFRARCAEWRRNRAIIRRRRGGVQDDYVKQTLA